MTQVRTCITTVAIAIIAIMLAAAPAGAQDITVPHANRPAKRRATRPAANPAPAAQRDANGKLKIVVTVEERAPGPDYNAGKTSTATRTDTPTIDIPQSIAVIPRQLLEDQAVTSLAGAVRNAPGVDWQQGEGNRDEFYIRGVETKSDFFVDGLRDDSEYFRPLYNVSHVDVLQGPAALLFGRGGEGGVINLVTRQPGRARTRHFSFDTGSYGEALGTVDVGGAIGAASAFRLMAMGEHTGGFRDQFDLRRYGINPKFDTALSATTHLGLSFSYLDDHRVADRGIPSRAGRPAPVPIAMFFGSASQNWAQARVSRFDARLDHQFSQTLTLDNRLLLADNDRAYQNLYPGSSVASDGTLKLSAYHHPTQRFTTVGRSELTAHFSTGGVQHTLLAGIEADWQRDHDFQTLPTAGSKSLPGRYSVSNLEVPTVAFNYLDRDNRVTGNEIGLYAEDQVALGRRWLVLLGERWDRFAVDAHYLAPGANPDRAREEDTNWSPRTGLIYKLVPNDSLYASFTQTFTPQGANLALSLKSPATANLAPEKAVNYEIGNKLALWSDRLSLTGALFQTGLSNMVAPAADGSGLLVSTGQQRNRGGELTATGALTPRLSVHATYTHLNAVITSTTSSATAGARVGLVPRDQASVWAHYTLTPHWGVAAGVGGGAARYTSYNNLVTLPGFAKADVMVEYSAAAYHVRLNVLNLTNTTYYPTASGDNQIMPGAPRSVSLNFGLNF